MSETTTYWYSVDNRPYREPFRVKEDEFDIDIYSDCRKLLERAAHAMYSRVEDGTLEYSGYPCLLKVYTSEASGLPFADGMVNKVTSFEVISTRTLERGP